MSDSQTGRVVDPPGGVTDRIMAANITALADDLNRAVAQAVDMGLRVDVSILEMNRLGQRRATPVMEVEVSRPLAASPQTR